MLFLSVMLTMCVVSCSNQEGDFLDKLPNSEYKDFELVKLSDILTPKVDLKNQNQIIMKFKDRSAYDRILAKLQKMSESEQDAWISKIKGFTSLQEIFHQAMADMDNVDETEVKYMAFKNKYSNSLYFPMYKEDYGVYLPVSEHCKSLISSPSGLVMIGNEIMDLRDIRNYTDLQKTGQAYYNNDCVTRALSTTEFSRTNNDFIGSEFDSGWFVSNKRKLRLKIGRKSNKENINPTPTKPGFLFAMNLKLEVSFRKKTWLGWSNYASATNTDMVFVIGSVRKTYNYSEHAWSSHDWLCDEPLPWWRDGVSNPYPNFYTPEIQASFTTQFRGFDAPIQWSCTLPAVNFTEF